MCAIPCSQSRSPASVHVRARWPVPSAGASAAQLAPLGCARVRHRATTLSRAWRDTILGGKAGVGRTPSAQNMVRQWPRVRVGRRRRGGGGGGRFIQSYRSERARPRYPGVGDGTRRTTILRTTHPYLSMLLHRRGRRRKVYSKLTQRTRRTPSATALGGGATPRDVAA